MTRLQLVQPKYRGSISVWHTRSLSLPNRSGREHGHSPTSTDELKNEYKLTSTSPYAFRACKRATSSLLLQHYRNLIRGGVVIKALRYKPAGRGFDSRWCNWIFFSDIILPVALWSWGSTQPLTEMSTRCISWG